MGGFAPREVQRAERVVARPRRVNVAVLELVDRPRTAAGADRGRAAEPTAARGVAIDGPRGPTQRWSPVSPPAAPARASSRIAAERSAVSCSRRRGAGEPAQGPTAGPSVRRPAEACEAHRCRSSSSSGIEIDHLRRGRRISGTAGTADRPRAAVPSANTGKVLPAALRAPSRRCSIRERNGWIVRSSMPAASPGGRPAGVARAVAARCSARGWRWSRSARRLRLRGHRAGAPDVGGVRRARARSARTAATVGRPPLLCRVRRRCARARATQASAMASPGGRSSPRGPPPARRRGRRGCARAGSRP